jgi:hypothetical protein
VLCVMISYDKLIQYDDSSLRELYDVQLRTTYTHMYILEQCHSSNP